MFLKCLQFSFQVMKIDPSWISTEPGVLWCVGGPQDMIPRDDHPPIKTQLEASGKTILAVYKLSSWLWVQVDSNDISGQLPLGTKILPN